MTIRQVLIGMLVDYGLWQQEAAAVLAQMEAEDTTSLRYGDTPDQYPAPVMAAMELTARRAALEWLKANAPKHWAIGVLEDAP